VVIFICLLVATGCGGNTNWNLIGDQEQQEVKSVATSMGQRTFDVSKDNMTKALVNAFSSKDLTVLTVEKDAGFIMAEGPQFLDKESLLDISKERRTKFNSRYGNPSFVLYAIPDVDLRITANLYGKENNRTLIKMKINAKHKNCTDPGGYKIELDEEYCPLPPSMVSRWYQQLWDEIEKSIFMQRETILD
jgi:hypothetical protein